MNDPPNDSYIAALLCLGGAGGIATNALFRRVVEATAAGIGPTIASIALAVGLFTVSLLLIHDHEKQRYDHSGSQ